MGKLRNKLKKNKVLRNLYHKLLNLTPQKIYFNKNLRKVVEFDNNHGTDFSGRIYQDELGTTKERANDYSPSPDKLIKCLEKMNINSSDSIVDMGCGKGYAMYIMSGFAFGKIGGVELSTKLCNTAKNNLKKMMPSECSWEVFNCDAGKWDKYDDYNIFYLYNPFPKEVLIEVKRLMEDSIKRKKRKVLVLYLMPRCAEVFLEDSVNWKLIKRGTIFEQKRGMNIFENNI